MRFSLCSIGLHRWSPWVVERLYSWKDAKTQKVMERGVYRGRRCVRCGMIKEIKIVREEDRQ